MTTDKVTLVELNTLDEFVAKFAEGRQMKRRGWSDEVAGGWVEQFRGQFLAHAQRGQWVYIIMALKRELEWVYRIRPVTVRLGGELRAFFPLDLHEWDGTEVDGWRYEFID